MIEPRAYRADDVAGFLKTRERFGALSNMASGYPILVGDMTHHVATSPFQAAALVGEPQASDAFSPGAPARGRNP